MRRSLLQWLGVAALAALAIAIVSCTSLARDGTPVPTALPITTGTPPAAQSATLPATSAPLPTVVATSSTGTVEPTTGATSASGSSAPEASATPAVATTMPTAGVGVTANVVTTVPSAVSTAAATATPVPAELPITGTGIDLNALLGLLPLLALFLLAIPAVVGWKTGPK